MIAPSTVDLKIQKNKNRKKSRVSFVMDYILIKHFNDESKYQNVKDRKKSQVLFTVCDSDHQKNKIRKKSQVGFTKNDVHVW